jgi:hypothetical protein
MSLTDRPQKSFEMDMVLSITAVTHEPKDWSNREQWKDDRSKLPDGFYISDSSNMVYLLMSHKVIWLDVVDRFFYDTPEH